MVKSTKMPSASISPQSPTYRIVDKENQLPKGKRAVVLAHILVVHTSNGSLGKKDRVAAIIATAAPRGMLPMK